MRCVRISVAGSIVFALCFAAIAQVIVPGSGSVGVGQMTGGTINIGIAQEQLAAAIKASGDEHKRLLLNIQNTLNDLAKQGRSESDAFTITVVDGFLATVKGKRVPQSDWPRVLNELANRYLELGARIATTPVTSAQIKALVSRADEARKAGDLIRADVLLEEATTQAIADAALLKEEARASNRQAASLLASRASLAFTRLEREKGADLLQRAFEQRADDVSSETFWWLIEASDAWEALGNTQRVLRIRTLAQSVAAAKSAADPGNSQWQLNLAISQGKIGDIQQAQGNLGAALKSYQTCMAIMQKLAAADPGNSQWQRELSVSHNKIGEIQQAQGNLGTALKSYQTCMAIMQKLAAADPGNSQWQLDLSVSHERIGDVQQTQGNLGAALKSYQASMAIMQKLAAVDPSNSQWQLDLAVSYWKIGTLAAPTQNKADRTAMLLTGLRILEGFEQRGLLAAQQAEWPVQFRQAITDLQ